MSTPINPDDVLPWTVVRAGHAAGRAFWTQLGSVGLRPHLFGILLTLQSEPGLSSAELARRVLVSPQSMSKLLTGLQRDGLVERTGARRRRGQALQLRLTGDGHEALARAFPVLGDLADPHVWGLTSEEGAQLNQLLHKLLAADDQSTS